MLFGRELRSTAQDLLLDLRPVRFGVREYLSGMGIEVLLQATLSAEQVEPAVDYAPSLGIDIRRDLSEGRGPRAETAILRCIANRLGGEGVTIRLAGEVPGGAKPGLLDIRRSLDRAAFGEIGDGVIAEDRHIPEIAGVDRHVLLGARHAAPHQRRGNRERG